MMNYKLDKIVREYLVERLGETTMHKYPRLLQIAISGLREFNQDVEGIINTVELTVNDNDTVDLPTDYLDYRIIGVCARDGSIQSLGINPDMCPPLVDECGDITGTVSRNQDVPLTDYNSLYFQGTYVRNGEIMGRRYGLGGGQNIFGYYRVWRDRGYIAVQNYRGGSLILEYLADIQQIDKEHQVHPFMVEMLKAWIYWKQIQSSRNYPQNEKQAARREYYNQKRLAKKRIHMLNIKELLQSFRTYYGPAVHV